MRVKLNVESGFKSFVENTVVVVSSKYVRNESWCGWVYLLTTKNLAKPIEIGEIWLELAPAPTEAKHKRSISL